MNKKKGESEHCWQSEAVFGASTPTTGSHVDGTVQEAQDDAVPVGGRAPMVAATTQA